MLPIAIIDRAPWPHAWTTATLASAAPASNATAARTADLGAALEQRDAPHGAAKPLLRPARGVLAQSTRIKDITFEGGSLTDPTTGADSATAGVTLETSAPLKGGYSATIANNSTGNLTENITAVDELFVSLYIRPASFPASARIVQIQNSGTTVGSISLTSSGTLQLKSGSTTLGTSSALSANTLYRIGIHQKKGTGADGVLEAFVAVGDAAFGAAFASSASQSFTSQASKLVVGATNSNAVDATLDDIRLDSAVMPGPSGGGSPTATPTNTPAGPTATPTNTPTGPTATPTTTPTGPSAPAAYDQSMTYDALGNLLSKTGVGSYAYGANGNGTGAGPHQARTVGGSTYSYDANGNLVSGGGRTYSWRADNLPLSVTRAGVTEAYTYDGDGTRVAKTVGGVTTVYFAGLWEQVVGGASTQYYTFNGQVVAVRDSAAGVSYLYGDQLGSVSFATSANGSSTSRQDFDAWGAVRSGGISQTTLNYTGQRLDSTGLLDYHARLYDPTLARFVSADSVVPSSASGGLDGVQLKGLTTDFHEPGFVATLNGENARGFWFELSGDDRRQAGVPWGPANPQALNRYSYVLNNPISCSDPSGHITYTRDDAIKARDYLRKHASDFEDLAAMGNTVLILEQISLSLAGRRLGIPFMGLLSRQSARDSKILAEVAHVAKWMLQKLDEFLLTTDSAKTTITFNLDATDHLTGGQNTPSWSEYKLGVSWEGKEHGSVEVSEQFYNRTSRVIGAKRHTVYPGGHEPPMRYACNGGMPC